MSRHYSAADIYAAEGAERQCEIGGHGAQESEEQVQCFIGSCLPVGGELRNFGRIELWALMQGPCAEGRVRVRR